METILSAAETQACLMLLARFPTSESHPQDTLLNIIQVLRRTPPEARLVLLMNALLLPREEGTTPNDLLGRATAAVPEKHTHAGPLRPQVLSVMAGLGPDASAADALKWLEQAFPEREHSATPRNAEPLAPEDLGWVNGGDVRALWEDGELEIAFV